MAHIPEDLRLETETAHAHVPNSLQEHLPGSSSIMRLQQHIYLTELTSWPWEPLVRTSRQWKAACGTTYLVTTSRLHMPGWLLLGSLFRVSGNMRIPCLP